MPSYEPLDLSQPSNDLSKIADAQRAKLKPKNDYKQTANEYSATNKDALADGDAKGKGTGGDLDVYNNQAGSITDITKRKEEIVINEYQPTKPYTTPTA